MSPANRSPHLQSIMFLIIFAVITIVAFQYRTELFHLFGDRATIQQTVESWGRLSPIIFVLLNIIQVIVAPIPGTAIGLAGGYLFGIWLGFFLNIIGVIVGSLLAFMLTKRFGKPFVDRFVGPRTSRWIDRIAKRSGIRGLTVAFLLPFFPDDALCFIAGLTPLRTRTFLIIVIVGRSPASFVASLAGAGIVSLPLWAWIVLGVATIILCVAWWLWGENVEQWVHNTVTALRSKPLRDD